MTLDTIATILIACVPTLAAICANVGGIIKTYLLFKKNDEKIMAEFDKRMQKVEKAFKDIAELKAKVASIEKYLIEEKEAHK